MISRGTMSVLAVAGVVVAAVPCTFGATVIRDTFSNTSGTAVALNGHAPDLALNTNSVLSGGSLPSNATWTTSHGYVTIKAGGSAFIPGTNNSDSTNNGTAWATLPFVYNPNSITTLTLTVKISSAWNTGGTEQFGFLSAATGAPSSSGAPWVSLAQKNTAYGSSGSATAYATSGTGAKIGGAGINNWDNITYRLVLDGSGPKVVAGVYVNNMTTPVASYTYDTAPTINYIGIGRTWEEDGTYSNLIVDVTPVPEPVSAGVLGAASALILMRRRKA